MNDPISRDEAVAAVLGTAIEYQLIYGKKEPKEGFVRSLIKRLANIPPQEEASALNQLEKERDYWMEKAHSYEQTILRLTMNAEGDE